jgi:hypothetical protein
VQGKIYTLYIPVCQIYKKYILREEDVEDGGFIYIALCRLCEEEMETPEHLLTECPVLNNDRQELFYSFQLSRVPDWDSKILTMVMLPPLAALED